MKFEYRICNSQGGLITFVNGDWQGTRPPDDKEALESCPKTWAYLQTAGQDAWELVAVVSRFRSRKDDQPILDRLLFPSEKEQAWDTWDTLYLKRSVA